MSNIKDSLGDRMKGYENVSTKWVEWANHVDPKEYDPFASEVV